MVNFPRLPFLYATYHLHSAQFGLPFLKYMDSDQISIKIKLLYSKISSNISPSKCKLKNPNWSLFSQLTESYMNTNKPLKLKLKIKNYIIHITESIINAANLPTGLINSSIKYNEVPWRNFEIKLSIKNKNRALKLFV